MNNTNTGGPAFPALAQWKGGPHPTNALQYVGMTLRDYFAAKAMQGLLSDSGFGIEKDSLAKHAYQYADEMMKARES